MDPKLVISARLIPIRNLKRDEDTRDDDEKVERNGEPVLFADVFSDASK